MKRLCPLLVVVLGCNTSTPSAPAVATSLPAAPPPPLGHVTDVALGGMHTCALLDDRTVRCWGANQDGQLGDGTTESRMQPTRVAGLADVVRITAGYHHTCALDAHGAVWCWGANEGGQLGIPGPTEGAPFVQGEVQILDGTHPPPPRNARTTPVKVDIAGVEQLAAGGFHTCAILQGGAVWCWGANGVGELGDGTTQASRAKPAPVRVMKDVAQVAPGKDYTCALSKRGKARCWGGTLHAEIAELTDGVEIDARHDMSCARRKDGAVLCWGANDVGQLGDGTVEHRAGAVQVTGLVAEAITVGFWHGCALDGEHRVLCWGQNYDDQLGDDAAGALRFRTRAAPVPGLGPVTRVRAGYMHTCAVMPDATVRCWGQGLHGELGNGASTARSWEKRPQSFVTVVGGS